MNIYSVVFLIFQFQIEGKDFRPEFNPDPSVVKYGQRFLLGKMRSQDVFLDRKKLDMIWADFPEAQTSKQVVDTCKDLEPEGFWTFGTDPNVLQSLVGRGPHFGDFSGHGNLECWMSGGGEAYPCGKKAGRFYCQSKNSMQHLKQYGKEKFFQWGEQPIVLSCDKPSQKSRWESLRDKLCPVKTQFGGEDKDWRFLGENSSKSRQWLVRGFPSSAGCCEPIAIAQIHGQKVGLVVDRNITRLFYDLVEFSNRVIVVDDKGLSFIDEKGETVTTIK